MRYRCFQKDSKGKAEGHGIGDGEGAVQEEYSRRFGNSWFNAIAWPRIKPATLCLRHYQGTTRVSIAVSAYHLHAATQIPEEKSHIAKQAQSSCQNGDSPHSMFSHRLSFEPKWQMTNTQNTIITKRDIAPMAHSAWRPNPGLLANSLIRMYPKAAVSPSATFRYMSKSL